MPFGLNFATSNYAGPTDPSRRVLCTFFRTNGLGKMAKLEELLIHILKKLGYSIIIDTYPSSCRMRILADGKRHDDSGFKPDGPKKHAPYSID